MDNKKFDDINEKRNKLWEDMKGLNDLILKEDRSFTSDEQENWDKMDKDFESMTGELDKMKADKEADVTRQTKIDERNEYMKSVPKAAIKPDPVVKAGDNETQDDLPSLDSIRTEYRDIFRGYRERTKGRYAQPEYGKAFDTFLIEGMQGLNREEQRALQADEDIKGGYLVTPEQFIAKLLMQLDNLVFMRQKATIVPVPKADSLGFPALDNDVSDPTWTGEILTGTEDDTLSFEKRALFPHPLAKRIRVSEKLLRVAVLPVNSIIRSRLAYKFAVVEENAFLNGDGSNEPLGVFTASDAGISTGRDMSDGNTGTAMKADGLINAKYNLKSQYHRKCEWIFHRDAIKQIRKLKTGDGDYIWRQGISSDRPDTILDRPFSMSEYAPNVFTASLYVGIVGDFSFYWIADALNMQIQVLRELYAETAQVGYIGRKETDAMPVLEEAFTRVKLGT